MITPLPRPVCACVPWSPKKNWNHGSLLRGWRTALLVLMLTTAGAALRAAALKLPAAGCAEGEGGASMSAIPALLRVAPRRSQSGCKVATTKYAAASTVTAWENNNQ